MHLITENGCGTTTFDVKKRWSLRKGSLFRQIQCAWILMAEEIFTDWKTVFLDRVVFPEGVVPARFHYIILKSIQN